MAAAEQAQPELFEPVHESRQPERQERHPERVYARRWAARAAERLSSGCSLLAHIIGPTVRLRQYGVVREPTQAEATAVACVVQWLGTNVGSGFLRACEDEIRELNGAEDHLRRYPWAWGEQAAADWTEAAAILALAHVPVGSGQHVQLLSIISQRLHGYRESTDNAYRQEIARLKIELAERDRVAYENGRAFEQRQQAAAVARRTAQPGAARAIVMREDA